MNLIAQISRFLVGVLFIFSGLIKINDPAGTAIKLEEYFEVFAADFASFFTIFVPASMFLSVLLSVMEVVLGIAVLINYRMKITAWVLLGLIVFFTFLTFYSAYFNKVTDCGCFGDAIKLTPWESFTKDIILLILTIIIFIKREAYTSMLSIQKSDMVIGIVTAINIFIAVYAIMHLPYIDFRPYKIGNSLPQEMLPEEPPIIEYVFMKDGKEVKSEKYLSPDEGYEYKESKTLNEEKSTPKITDYQVTSIEGDDYTEESFTGNKLFIIITDAQKADAEGVEKINNLLKNISPEITPMILTASSEEIFEQYRHEWQLAIPYYYTDATVLKAMIRSNPGLMLLQDGEVLGKWHYNDVPEAQEVNQLVSLPVSVLH